MKTGNTSLNATLDWWFMILLCGSMALYTPALKWLLVRWLSGYGSTVGILPLIISMVMIWHHLKSAPNISPRYPVGGFILILVGYILWFISWVADAPVGQAYTMPFVFAGLVWLYKGERKLAMMWFPLIYIILAFPIPALVEHQISLPLRLWSARLAHFFISTLGWPGELHGTVVIGPQFSFDVTPACSGLKTIYTFLIAGVLVSRLLHKSWKFFLIQVALIFPAILLANSLRITTIAGIGYYWGEKSTHGLNHEASGILFFTLCFLMFVALGRKISARFGAPEAKDARPTGELTTEVSKARSWRIAHASSLVLVLLFAAVIEFGTQKAETAQVIKTPYYFGGWAGSDIHLSAYEVESYQAHPLEKRRYIRGKDIVEMAMATFTRAERHDPRECFPANGWKQMSSELVKMESGTERFSVYMMRFKYVASDAIENKNLVCFYWFQSPHQQFATTEWELMVNSVKSRLFHGRDISWMFFNITMPCQEGGELEVYGRARQFIGEMQNQIKQDKSGQ